MQPQFSDEERNFLIEAYIKRKGDKRNVPRIIIQEFQAAFPNARVPILSQFDEFISSKEPILTSRI